MPDAAAPVPPSRSRRWAAALAGGSSVGGLAALLDARSAIQATVEPPPWGATWLALMGLIAPLALALAGAVGLASLALHPEAPPSLGRLTRWLQPAAPERRRGLALAAPLAVLGALGWTVLLARLGLRQLVTEAPAGVTAAALGLGGALSLLAVVVAVRAAFDVAAAQRWRAPSPLVTASVAAVVAAAIFAWAVSSGTSAGTGGTLGVFGVLKRDELDLRAPGLLLLLVAGAYLAPAALARLPLAALLALGLAPLGLSYHAAHGGLEARQLALAVERSAPLSKLLLPRWRKLGDADGDGVSRLFGGGDCNDADPSVRPGADDLPGDGVDQDCSGQDAAEVSFEPAPAPLAKPALAQELPKEPIVVLITVDTLRWDLGYAGNPRPVSRSLDALAARSTVYERAYALASYTGKSIGPMLAGKYGSETHRGWSHFNSYGKSDTMIQERLQAAGVRTVSVQCHWYFKENTGLGRGFDVLDLSAAPRQLQMEGDRGVLADKVTDAAIAQLGVPENVRGKSFVWAHYLDPHAEYVKSPEFDFGSDARALYDSEVANTDRHVGRLLKFIEESAFADRAIIIVTSDHGEAFGEHGLLRHGFEVWEELVRVPLIVHLPGRSGRRITARRSAIDLAPTLLGIFGAPAPTGEGTDFMSGQSLLPELLGGAAEAPAERVVFVDMAAGPNNAERQAFIEHGLKVIATAGRPLGVYDLDADPDEKKDLLDKDPRAATAVERFKAFRRQLRVVNVTR